MPSTSLLTCASLICLQCKILSLSSITIARTPFSLSHSLSLSLKPQLLSASNTSASLQPLYLCHVAQNAKLYSVPAPIYPYLLLVCSTKATTSPAMCAKQHATSVPASCEQYGVKTPILLSFFHKPHINQ